VTANDALCSFRITFVRIMNCGRGRATSDISHALSQLTDAGLLRRRKDGKWRKYRTAARASALLVALDGSRG